MRRRGNPLWLPLFGSSLVRAGAEACPYSLQPDSYVSVSMGIRRKVERTLV
jgi:hypothetical protein